MTRIYLDNAATSWPKPPAVYDAIDRYQRDVGAPAGRGAYRDAMTAERCVMDTRTAIAKLIGANDPRRVIFTYNGTDSLNMAIAGLLRPGDHVITSVVEHNSTLRPLRRLESQQVQVTRVRCDPASVVDIDALQLSIRPNTRLIALLHASNVTGAIQPIAKVAELARQRGILFLLDAAQSLGHLPLDVSALPIDVLAAPGHKGLLGPLGTGILYVRPELETELQPQRSGGTGTDSERDEQPAALPERYEAGNLNVPGIAGLGAGVQYLLDQGIDQLREHEIALTERLWSGLKAIRNVQLYGPASTLDRVGVVSFRVGGYDPQEVAAHLDVAHSIQVRAGLHCAPLVHAALGTVDQGGTIRMSLGPFTTESDVDAAIQAVAEAAED